MSPIKICMNPHLLWSNWSSVRERLIAAKQLLLFLDYDGTLVALADHPAEAKITPRTRDLLQRLANQPGVYVTLLSGRSLSDLRNIVEISKAWYIGNHGLELEASLLHHVNPLAWTHQSLLQEIAQQLKRALSSVPGAWLEDKTLTLSVHYRCVPETDWMHVKNIFYQILRHYQEKHQVYVTSGKSVFEVRPPVRWNEGMIINWLLTRQLALSGEESSLAIYLGDDLADEDTFAMLKPRGVTVAVGPSTPLTQAQYYVKTPSDVQRLLRLILGIRTRKNSV